MSDIAYFQQFKQLSRIRLSKCCSVICYLTCITVKTIFLNVCNTDVPIVLISNLAYIVKNCNC